MSAATPRRDAARSRAAILAAARELFSSGEEVPMYEIGRRAGVGQATLYRHFPSREDIAAAVLCEYVERLEETANQNLHDPAGLLAVLDRAISELVHTHELVALLRADRSRAQQLSELRERVLATLEGALMRSREQRLLHEQITAADLLLTLNMVNGAIAGITAQDERQRAAKRAFELALTGLRRQASA